MPFDESLDAARGRFRTDPITGPTALGPILVPRLRLEVLDGPMAGQVVHSQGERLVIGTHPSADLVLPDRAVSRFHCELAIADAAVHVRDLGSRNGTRVDTVHVKEATLHDGALLVLGRTRLRFAVGDDVVEVPAAPRAGFGPLVGRSPAMRGVFALLERAAATDSTVLLEGETGTGKDVAAEAVWSASERRDGPFVVVDCGSLPDNLVESELFGHAAGAFTGAVRAREGAFAAASGGTIFLDEVGELPLASQARLLRAIDSREIKPVGAERYQKVDVRIIAATNRDLRAAANAGTFRADLFFRLSVIAVHLPPLRERLEDLPLLVDHLLATMGALEHPAAARVRAPAWVRELARQSWPGNVRELRNHLERALTFEGPPAGAAAAVPARPESGAAAPGVDSSLPLRVARDRWSRHFEEEYLRSLLARHGGNVTAAARQAGVDRVHLHRLIARHGVRPPGRRP